jgi:hypothetical protein
MVRPTAKTAYTKRGLEFLPILKVTSIGYRESLIAYSTVLTPSLSFNTRYCNPAFLRNDNSFKLGTSQDGELMGDVGELLILYSFI